MALCIEKNRLQPEPDKAQNLGQSGSSGKRAEETLTIRDTNAHDLHSYATSKSACVPSGRTWIYLKSLLLHVWWLKIK